MKFAPGIVCLAMATAVSSAPSNNHHDQLSFTPASIAPTASISSWLSNGIASLLEPLTGAFDSAKAVQSGKANLAPASDEDKSIYDIITEHAEFSKLAKAVNYSSDSTKELLKGKTGVKLTLFAPVNWHDHGDDDDDDDHFIASQTPSRASLAHGKSSWTMIERKIDELHASDDDDDDDRERKRRRLAHFIDGVLAYHLVDSEHPLVALDVVENSTLATKLSITGKAAEYLGPLNDGLPLRIRVGKSLIPKPGVYLNFYSRVIYPDIKLSNGILHAVQYPLFQFPSILQGLYAAQPEFSTLTTGFLKTEAEGYFALPPVHKHHDDDGDDSAKTADHRDDDHRGRKPRHISFSDHKGSPASTLFAPSNLAWDALPWAFRAYLFSPFGEDLLGKVLMLHSIPQDLVYADSVHHVKGHNKPHEPETISYDITPTVIHRMAAMLDGDEKPSGRVNVTKYTFNSVLPKLKDGEDLPPPDKAKEFETVDVEVWRYRLLGNRGPLQTRLRVQGKAVAVHDIVNLNGATHLINHFIKPKGHHEHRGIWHQVAREASLLGFGHVDMAAEIKADAW